MKETVKRLLPRWLHHAVNRVLSKAKIRRRLGDWFDLEWKHHAGDLPDEHWVRTYDQSWENWADHDLHPDDLVRVRDRVGHATTLLDAGCGDGYLLNALATVSDQRTGCDLSMTGLKLARERLGEGFPLVQCFLEAMPFVDDAFDVVVTTHVLEHVKELQASIAELKRITRRRLIVIVPRQEYLPYTEDYHLHFFPEPEDLLAAFGHPADATLETLTIPAGVCAYSGDIHLLTIDFSER